MALVRIEGMFMGANLNQSNFDGKQKVSVQVDLYQKNSPEKNKAVAIKTDDLEQLSYFNQNFEEGSMVEVLCTTNAYKNETYYKLVRVLGESA
ncbi:hypothetical protein [Paenibacillus sp. SI8]|uniref:hypothetical protein n=1 Tax=unclassified Paenibacillus TaxID=185978 RepID=UPI0034661088